MRLTADLINNSLSYLNPLKERELDLRGMSQIPMKEQIATLF
jgi:U2 small nuclear ribonucleoprotein A'